MAGIPLLLIALLAGIGYQVLQSTKINSAEYGRIIDSKDLVADVLPPPQQIEGSLLAAFEIADGVEESNYDEVTLASTKLKRLQREFETRHDFWDKKLTDPVLRSYLLDRAYKPAQAFYAKFENELLPAVARQDEEEVHEIVRAMRADYATHLKAIQQVIKLANAEQINREQTVADKVKTRLGLLTAGVILMLGLAGALGWFTLRSITKRINRLRQVATEELPRAIAQVKAATAAGETAPTLQPIKFDNKDELTDAADAFNSVLGSAVNLATEQAVLRQTTSAMFVNLGRRNHKLLSRTLSYISDLERTERDPQTLQNLFKLDHLTTRQRRNAESLLVLAGSAPLRTWSKPVPVADVLRASLSEIESYDRVDVSDLEDMAIKGGAVSDIAHLLAEILENATNFSAPQTRVRVLGRVENKNYALIVVDQGIGMGVLDIEAANQRIAVAANNDLESSKMLGLGVVGRLAARHDISVRLAQSPSGGLAVKITLPSTVVQSVTDLRDQTVAAELEAAAQTTQPSDSTGEISMAQLERTMGSSEPAPAETPQTPEPVAAQAEPAVPASADQPAASAIQGQSVDAEPAESPEAVAELPTAPTQSTGFERPSGFGRLGSSADSSQTPPPPPAPPILPPMPQLPLPNYSTPQRPAVAHPPAPPLPAAATARAAVSAARTGGWDAPALPALNPEVPLSHGGLTRRVRGAQLPDTGPERVVTEPAPARSAETVRSALAQFSAGRSSAHSLATADPVAGNRPGAPVRYESNQEIS